MNRLKAYGVAFNPYFQEYSIYKFENENDTEEWLNWSEISHCTKKHCSKTSAIKICGKWMAENAKI